jgi:DNA-binding MarR family transcriptional regulator
MNDANALKDAQAVGGATCCPSAFYCGESYQTDDSIEHLMRRIVTAVCRAVESRMCGPDSLTYPQWVPLYKLYSGEASSVAELARACELDTGAMTRLLDRIEAKGFCRRVRSPEDRRVVNIELTANGSVAVKELPYVLSRVQNEHLAGFADEEWDQLKEYLRRIFDNAQALKIREDKGGSDRVDHRLS